MDRDNSRIDKKKCGEITLRAEVIEEINKEKRPRKVK